MNNPLVSGLGGVMMGFAGALIFCWFRWVRPMQANLDAREKSLQEWERINRMEREAIGTIKTISIEELRKWVATVDEQNRRFAELQRLTHEQELELAGPPRTHLFLAAGVVLGVVGLVVYWLRDGNASAATTLDNIAALAPDQVIRSAVMTRLVRPPVTSGMVVETTPVAASPVNTPQLAPGEPRARGSVHAYHPERTFGWIRESGVADNLFHLDEVEPDDRARIRLGVSVSFRRGRDGKGRPAVLGVRIDADS